jgi:phosphopantetheine--protein transferase-like protein
MGRTALNFSVSHSGAQALLGFARGRRIGVDLERVSANVDGLELAERYFSSNEFETLGSLTAEMQHEAFYCGWTRKEAYLKARGEGIFFGLERVEVSLVPGERAIIRKDSDDPNYLGASQRKVTILRLDISDGNQIKLQLPHGDGIPRQSHSRGPGITLARPPKHRRIPDRAT